ncbi:TIGR01459 family HAD-type hydrolase [Halovulum dunhuangense]|uniref:TIGR01459 family HAD-type hydrolase n=2 Tax=Halovulum dunhuangense TaxID=1505036 RepID=A0A849L1N4_9RHOB|nr:TIGR01459 family HAD-type hydrolase [Halovulum dunhuangense]NNU80147.1 TIGR01459 family HAD-type hydrolase [Halovulum dunhuangense]
MAAPGTDWAFARYEQVRHRLPDATFPSEPRRAATLAELTDRYDAFILDAFGVLNVGEQPIPGAVARMAELRAAGKRLVVLTNGASARRQDAAAKYRRLGFDFTEPEIVASREVAAARLDRVAPGALWAAITQAGDDLADIPARCQDLIDTPGALDAADGILFLSAARWTEGHQQRLLASLRNRPRPLVVANPDIVAPREGWLSLEPGAFAHDIADTLGTGPAFFGKPYPDAFEDAVARLGGIPRARIAMVGDTLHTDILGGAAAGLGTVLVAAHGLFAGRDVMDYVRRSGIVPDDIVKTT